MFKTPLIKLASLGLLMVGAQAGGGDGSCDTGAQPGNTGDWMTISMLTSFLSAVPGAQTSFTDGLGNLNDYTETISCSSTGTACEVIAMTPLGMVVGRSSIGGATGDVALTVYGDDSTTLIAGLAAGEEIKFHLVDNTGTLFDIRLSPPISYASNGLGLLDDTTDAVFVFNCGPGAGAEGAYPTDNGDVPAVASVVGCKDATACNFNGDATEDDGSCTYADDYKNCDGACLNDDDGDQVCDNADVNPVVASVQTCPHQEDYWLEQGCACGGGAGTVDDTGSAAWCVAQKGLWTDAGCGAQCSA